MKRFLLLLLLAAPACQPADGTSSSEHAVTDDRRARLARLSKVDALARLYLGHELDRSSLVALGTKSTTGVVDDLVKRPDFKRGLEARAADFSGSTRPLDPNAMLGDSLGADAPRFANWLVNGLAPLAATEIVKENGRNFPKMTYRELLDTIRAASSKEES